MIPDSGNKTSNVDTVKWFTVNILQNRVSVAKDGGQRNSLQVIIEGFYSVLIQIMYCTRTDVREGPVRLFIIQYTSSCIMMVDHVFACEYYIY